MTPDDIIIVDTPEKVILAIHEGWSKEAKANTKFWRVQYLKQLDVHRGPDLAAGWQRCLENNPGGFPPKPDIIAAMCRKLKEQQRRINAPDFVREESPPPSKILSPEMLAFDKRQIAELSHAIKNDTAGPMAADLLRWYQVALDAHRKAVEGRR